MVKVYANVRNPKTRNFQKKKLEVEKLNRPQFGYRIDGFKTFTHLIFKKRKISKLEFPIWSDLRIPAEDPSTGFLEYVNLTPTKLGIGKNPIAGSTC